MTTRDEMLSRETEAQVSKSIDNLAAEFETLLGKDAPALRVIQHLAASFPSSRVGAAADDADDEWGPAISTEEAAELEQANLQLQVEQRREQLNVSFTRVQAADMLGISPQTVSEWVAQHRLVGLKDGREWRFPAWQFTPDNSEPVLPELRRLVDAFPGGVVSLSRWMSRPNDNFGGRTPAQEMVRAPGHVFAIIETLAAA